MREVRYQIALRRPQALNPRGLSLAELARAADCHPELAERLARFSVIEPLDSAAPRWRFPLSSVARLRRALRLRSDLGVGAGSLGLVLDLLDRVERLENRLNALHRQEVIHHGHQ